MINIHRHYPTRVDLVLQYLQEWPTPLGENAFKDNRKYVIRWQPKAYIELDLSEYGHA